ncbi:hypothetical protein EVAR_81623_1 [Eumeta japonica]|uniref:Uncharacterized protein n=1 Tax=Eumeta variegata TaxID=151549 RepID=A0A4C1WDD7_EUMVA|nr:hypothetical protein EVAR_81623_1 [Eumeta japonica]
MIPNRTKPRRVGSDPNNKGVDVPQPYFKIVSATRRTNVAEIGPRTCASRITPGGGRRFTRRLLFFNYVIFSKWSVPFRFYWTKLNGEGALESKGIFFFLDKVKVKAVL